MSLPLVCVTLTGCTVDEMLKDAARATAVGADIVEVRLDKLWVIEQKPEPVEPTNSDSGDSRRTTYVAPIFAPQSIDSVDLDSSLISFRTGIELPVILTCRPERQGGYYPGTEKQRIAILSKAIKSGVSWIDLETDIDTKERNKLVKLAGKNTKIIASNHYDESPNSPSDIVEEISEYSNSGDIIKIVFNTNGKKDALRLFDVAWRTKDSEDKLSIMGLGAGGDWTRIHAPLLNQDIVYTTMENGWHLAQQGKINTSDLKTAWELLEYN
ncbi:type I 3-dehydroquinate dehydratase [Euryarchaeota archaeon]|nr:type I 3-dehydroquinate dehydratase [Euryarchaeota archaeon]MDC0962497.1 type I 3-dehydroquinate dehydratase [Euryarchaeota archaeon]